MSTKAKLNPQATIFDKKEYFTVEYLSEFPSRQIRADWSKNSKEYRLDKEMGLVDLEGNISLPNLRIEKDNRRKEFVLSINSKNGKLQGGLFSHNDSGSSDIHLVKTLQEYVEGASVGLGGIRNVLHSKKGDVFSFEVKIDMLNHVSRAQSAISVLSTMMLEGAKKEGGERAIVDRKVAPELLRLYRLI